ncbi:MAG TPA: hypothetical protein VFQ44_03850 [Streptosporangiaceae bacterium]|nr:hypothetical protein [Streptosporangiaceae bacterium]
MTEWQTLRSIAAAAGLATAALTASITALASVALAQSGQPKNPFSAACAAGDCCVTVGGRNGALAWNGRSWRKVGVSCASATNCLAVGRDTGALSLAQSWDGGTWKLLSPINP